MDWLTLIVAFRRWLGKKLAALKGFRTVICAGLIAAFGALQASNVINVLPPAWQPWGLVVVPALFAFLRTITSTPFGRSQWPPSNT